MKSIEIRELTKHFGDKAVLNRFSASVPLGKITCLMGESGCGKTTLIRILAGLEKRDSGEIEGMPESISFVFQEDRLISHLSALQNCILPLSGRDARQRGAEALCALGLSEDLHTPARDLSGGMARRVAIARAMIAKADIVIMDEPFKGLDEENKRHAVSYVLNQACGKTFLIVTHDAEEAAMLGAGLIRMEPVSGEKTGNSD